MYIYPVYYCRNTRTVKINGIKLPFKMDIDMPDGNVNHARYNPPGFSLVNTDKSIFH